jgi:hypothetical protein
MIELFLAFLAGFIASPFALRFARSIIASIRARSDAANRGID